MISNHNYLIIIISKWLPLTFDSFRKKDKSGTLSWYAWLVLSGENLTVSMYLFSSKMFNYKCTLVQANIILKAKQKTYPTLYFGLNEPYDKQMYWKPQKNLLHILAVSGVAFWRLRGLKLTFWDFPSKDFWTKNPFKKSQFGVFRRLCSINYELIVWCNLIRNGVQAIGTCQTR